MTRTRFPIPFLLAVPFSLLLAFTPVARGDVTLQPLATGLSAPVDIANAGDGSGRLFIVEQAGKIRIVQNGTLLAAPFLDIQSVVNFGGERGLLGLAFHPQYATNGRFFVFYTTKPLNGLADGDVVIARYQRSAIDANLAEATSAQVILSVPHSTFSNHNGGALRFGPDGYLYIGVGDGGSGGDPNNNGQNRNTLLAKILRIDINATTYIIPPTNPFVGTAGVRAEIWAYGVRNPFRFSFDRLTGDFYIGDVGQDLREEVNRQAAGFAGGANYGWRIFEGFSCFNSPTLPPNCTTPPADYVQPIFDYPHVGGASITGGYVYRGASTPDLLGKYIFADFVQSKIWFSPGDAGANFTQLSSLSQQVSTFGESEAGELYLANYSTGIIYSFSSSTDTTPDAVTFAGARNVSLNTITVSNAVKISGLGTNANISVAGGEYSIGCTAAFTAMPSTIANNATVCVRHTSANANNATVTTTLTVGSVAASYTSTTAASFALLAVQSRKTHVGVGMFDLAIDTTLLAPITVESRFIGTGHTIVFQFSGPITTPGIASISPVGVASAVMLGNDVVVTLTAVPDNQRVTVSLVGVNGNTPAEAAIGFAVGDVNNSQSVNSSDISSIKARSGQATTAANFKFDLNASGAINSSDISAVKARSGSVIP